VRYCAGVSAFYWLLAAQSVSLLGGFVAAFAVQAAVVFRMHGSARDASGVFLAALAPTVALGPVAGVFADRWNPRRTMIASDLARAALVALLTWAVSLPQIYAISFAVSCCSAFFSPAQTITVHQLVKPERLLAANATMQQAMQVVRVASPAAAGALVAWAGESACYLADSASFLISASVLAGISMPCVERAPDTRRVLNELREGVRFLLTDRRFSFVTFAMAAGTFATSCFTAVAPLYVRDVLRAGTSIYAAVGSLIAAGAVAGTFVVRGAAREHEPVTLIRAGMVMVGLPIFAMAWLAIPAVVLLGSFGIGLGAMAVMIAVAVVLQGQTPIGMRGRVSAASASVMAMAQAAAMIWAGGWAVRFGIRSLLVVSAGILFAVGAASNLRESHRVAAGQDAP